jgi:hypothetical protein
MRKLIRSIVLVGTAMLMLIPVQPMQPVQPVHATKTSVADSDDPPSFEIHYRVIYDCTCGPICYGWLVGEWTRDCEGNMTGWGMMPGDNCTRTEISSFQECY